MTSTPDAPVGHSDLVGREIATSAPYDVTAERVAEFRAATGGGSPGGAPATFPIVVVFPLLQRLLDDLGVPLSRVVHADQRFTYERPVVVGDRLSAVLTVRSVRGVGDDSLVSMRTEVRGADEALVCTASTMLLHRGEAA